MSEKQNTTQIEYEAMVKDLQKFCEKYTDLDVYILDQRYPLQVQFLPTGQLGFFENENIDENGEVNEMTVTCGLSTSVKSTLRFKMNAKLLKKLIKMAENVGACYYHAFRESADVKQDEVQEDSQNI